MKKLTFIEALKVNEDREVWIYSGVISSLTKYVFYAGDLKNSRMPVADLIHTDFYAEPEKISFECKWEDHFGIKPLVSNEKDMKSLHFLLGKKTKVIVEVIDE